MKYVLAILVVFCALITHAQYSEYEFNDEVYSVYPPRQRGITTFAVPFPTYHSNFNFFDDDGRSSSPVEADIIPYFDSLPNGKYIVFGPKGFKRFKFFKLKKAYSRRDTTRVNISFTLSEGKKNGLARWYGKKGSVLMEGNFLNDDKDGVWDVFDIDGNLIRKTTFHKGLREGPDVFFKDGDTVAIAHYNTDILNGEVRVYYKDRLAMKGTIEDNDEVGKWIFYHSNGNLASRFTYSDTSGNQILPFLYRSDLEQTYQRKNPIYYLVDKEIRARTQLNEEDLLDSLGIDDFDIYYQWEAPYDGTYETYSRDGKPIDVREYKGGYLTKEPKLYDFLGRLAEEVEVEQVNDSLVLAHVTRYNYGTSAYAYAWLIRYYEEHIYWRNHTVLRSVKHRKASRKEKKKGIAGKYTDYSFHEAYFDSVKNRDTIVVMDFTVVDDKDTVILKRMHLETGYIYRGEDDKLYEHRDKKGRLLVRRTVQYDAENKKMLIESTTFNKQGNVSWTNYSSYFNGSYLGDSLIVSLDGKPYTGKFEYVTKKARKGRGWMEGDVLKVHSEGQRRVGTFNNGRMDGVWEIYGSDGHLDQKITYKRGEKWGKQEIWATKSLHSSYLKEKASEFKIDGKEVHYLRASRSYLDEELHGEAKEYFWNGQQMFQGTYDHGRKHGKFMTWDIDGNPLKESFFVLDTIDGVSKRWNKYNFKLTSITDYDMGANNGIYKQWDATGDPVVFGQTKEDFKDGTWLTFYSDSLVKSEVIYNLEDSVTAQNWKDEFPYSLHQHFAEREALLYEEDFSNEYYDVEELIPTTSSGGREPGQYTFYYKTGEVARKGEVKDYVRTGTWKIWDEGGTLIKEIDYQQGEYIHTRADGTTDTIHHFGRYKSWHSSGNKEVEGYILAEYNNYDCYQEVDISVQDLFYVNFWDDSGNHQVKNGTGYLFLYDRSARPTSEGFVQDGIRHGLWKFRDKDGGLKEIGHFVEGEKHGKWYEGDLVGMHFVDNACFDLSDEEVKKRIDYDKNILSVTIIYYDLGTSVNRISYENNTNEEPMEREKYRRRGYVNTSIIDF